MCNNKLKNMKKIILALAFVTLLSSCESHYKEHRVKDEGLPEELKGLKIHSVPYYLGDSEYTLTVATLNNEVNSVSYKSGKTYKTVIMINNKERVIHAKEIISETDSILVIKK